MDNLKNLAIFIKDVIRNIFVKRRVVLVTEAANWAIREDCENIKNNLRGITDIHITTTPLFLKNKILHFASENMLVRKKGIIYASKANRIVLTWFHISDDDKYRLKYIKDLNSVVDFVHTASTTTRQKLIANGLSAEKIVLIPLGVDPKIFYPISNDNEKTKLKKKLGLPKGKLIIGSFQKDGNGWGNGDTPKLIKGPDIFCEVVEKLAKKYPIHVMLTGPARGYVKNRLEKAGITYTHEYVKRYFDTADYFRVLDLYIIASREEGGPKALLESMASGVPLVATKVGMVSDVLKSGLNGFMTEICDTEAIIENASKIIEDVALRKSLITNGLKTAADYSIFHTTRLYYDNIYKQLSDE